MQNFGSDAQDFPAVSRGIVPGQLRCGQLADDPRSLGDFLLVHGVVSGLVFLPPNDQKSKIPVSKRKPLFTADVLLSKTIHFASKVLCFSVGLSLRTHTSTAEAHCDFEVTIENLKHNSLLHACAILHTASYSSKRVDMNGNKLGILRYKPTVGGGTTPGGGGGGYSRLIRYTGVCRSNG